MEYGPLTGVTVSDASHVEYAAAAARSAAKLAQLSVAAPCSSPRHDRRASHIVASIRTTTTSGTSDATQSGTRQRRASAPRRRRTLDIAPSERHSRIEDGPRPRDPLKFATLAQLVEALTDHSKSTDYGVRNAVLLTYRAFCSPSELLAAFVARFEESMGVEGTHIAGCTRTSSNTTDDQSARLVDCPACRAACPDQGLGTGWNGVSSGSASQKATVIQLKVMTSLNTWLKSEMAVADVAADEQLADRLLAFLTSSTCTRSDNIHNLANGLQQRVVELRSAAAEAVEEYELQQQQEQEEAERERLRKEAEEQIAAERRRRREARRQVSTDVSSTDMRGSSASPTPESHIRRMAERASEPHLHLSSSLGAVEAPPPVRHTHTSSRNRSLTESSSRAEVNLLPGLRTYTAEDVAGQLTLSDRACLSNITPRELTLKAWTRNGTKRAPLALGGAPNVSKAIDLFNQRTSWIASEILCTDFTTSDRAEMLTFFIDVADHCFRLHNFNTLFAIVAGLKTPCISQLTTTWGLVQRPQLDRLELLKGVCSMVDNYKQYRHAMSCCDGMPRVPCLPVVVRDVISLEHSLKSHKDDLIHFGKYKRLYAAICGFLSSLEIPYHSQPPPSSQRRHRPSNAIIPRQDIGRVLDMRVKLLQTPQMDLWRLAKDANKQESMLFVNSLSAAGFL